MAGTDTHRQMASPQYISHVINVINVGVESYLVAFGIIKMIILDEIGHCCFMCELCESVYSAHLHCYELTRTVEVKIVHQNELIDYCPLYVYRIGKSEYVLLKHFIVDV